jgi:hypothetical protein
VAIDSAAKRRAAAGVPCHPLGPGVTPDAAKSASWRKQSAWGNAGGTVTAPMGRLFLIIGRGDKPSTALGRGDKPSQAAGRGDKPATAVGRGDKPSQAPGRGTMGYTIPGEGG